MLLIVCLFLACLSAFPSLGPAQQLSPSFYSSSCPNVVSTVTNTVIAISKKDNVVPPSTLRLIVHDCFVQGCDASILISSTSGNTAERDAPDNQNLPQNAFDAISQVKQAVEATCPGVVSCADILVLAARDAVVLMGGPTWEVPLGRRDGTVSVASAVAGRLPGANFDVTQLAANFGQQGLNLQDLVALSGAHTIGFSHCSEFSSRLYNFNSSVKVDPSINPAFVQQLKQKCVQNGADNLQALDVNTPFVFDNQYYKDLQAGKGVLFSDQVLFQDPSTQAMVNSMAGAQTQFFQSFVASMIKMTSTGVKVGSEGEIRKVCSAVNPNNGPSAGNPPVPPSTSPSPINPPQQNPTPNLPPPSPAGNPPVNPPQQNPPVNPPQQNPTPNLPPSSPAGNPPVNPPQQNPPVNPPQQNPTPTLPPPSPPPIQLPPPTPILPPPSPPPIPPTPILPPPSPPPIPPPAPTLPPPTPIVSPPTQPTPTAPPAFTVPAPPAFSAPSTPSFNSPPTPRFRVPGIPGFSPPFFIPRPRFRIPGFGGPPGQSSSPEDSGSNTDQGN